MDASYISFSAPGLSGVILKTGSDCMFDPVSLLSIPDDPALCCKKGRTVQAGVDGRYFVKRICHKSLWDSFRHLFMCSRPRHCLRAAGLLAEACVDTPRVLAALRKSRMGLPGYDYLITEDISADVIFADKMPLDDALLPALADLLARMHAHGIFHGDVNLRNLYRRHTGVWGVIDLDGCRLSRFPVSRSLRRKELARLASSFMKLAPEKEDIPRKMAEAYAASTGFDPDTPGYRKRIRYLVERKRK